MRLAGQVRSISYLKAHAAELLRDLIDTQEPLFVTQNGEVKAALIDISTFDQMQETAALLKLLSLADRQIGEGMLEPVDEALEAYRADG